MKGRNTKNSDTKDYVEARNSQDSVVNCYLRFPTTEATFNRARLQVVAGSWLSTGYPLESQENLGHGNMIPKSKILTIFFGKVRLLLLNHT